MLHHIRKAVPFHWNLTRPIQRPLSSLERMSNTLKIALCQINVGEDKTSNIQAATQAIQEAAANGANIVCLPECWNSPYDTKSFPEYSESIPCDSKVLDSDENPSSYMLTTLAKQLKIFVVGGSIPEKEKDDENEQKVYNTCIVVNPKGEIVLKHRKMHLFDIDVPGKITFKESDTLSSGSSVSTFDTPYGRIGVGICYDIRFPELSMLMREKGSSILIFPGAFNLTTGPAHWELLQRARAVDNQLFVATVSPARNPSSAYQAWGHSSVINPWGEVIGTTNHEPSIVYADLEMSLVDEMRRNIPCSLQKRHDIYQLVQVNKNTQ